MSLLLQLDVLIRLWHDMPTEPYFVRQLDFFDDRNNLFRVVKVAIRAHYRKFVSFVSSSFCFTLH